MAKRKTSCGNARMCSMLLTNFARSASYEALPNHRLFPAKFGLTGPLWNRWPQRSTLKMRNAFEEGQKRGYCGSTELEIVERISHLQRDRKSTRLNSSHVSISYAVFCLKKKNME